MISLSKLSTYRNFTFYNEMTIAIVQELETQVELYKSKEARKLVAEVKNNPIVL